MALSSMFAASPVAAAVGAVAALPLIGILVMVALDLWQRWRLRHIPGPRSWPILGNIREIMALGSPFFFQQCKKRYGPVFKVALGRTWAVVAADPELLRQAGYKLRNHAIVEQSLMRGVLKRMEKQNLFQARDEAWRLTRLAWQPAFSSASLSGYLPLMVGCARKLVARLEDRAAGAGVGQGHQLEGGSGSSRAGGPNGAHSVDLWRELGRMTLQVVGSTAFGVDFHTLDADAAALTVAEPTANGLSSLKAADHDAGLSHELLDGNERQRQQQQQRYGMPLMKACADVFRYGGAFVGSRYIRAALLLPELRPALSAVAHVLPDRPFTNLLQARVALREACLGLVDDWKQHKQQQQQQAQQQSGAAAADGLAVQDRHTMSPAGPLPGSIMDGNGRNVNGTVGADVGTNGDNGGGGSGAAGDGGGGGRTGLVVSPGSLLGLLLSARDKATGQLALSDENVVSQAQIFLLAGYETTANALAFAVRAVASHPEVESKLLAEIDSVLGRDRDLTEDDLARLPYAEAVFNEAVRLYPPAHATTRSVDNKPVQLGKYTVPAGIPLFLGIYSVHRDPAVWPRPDEFIPERFLPSSPLHAEVCARVPHAHVPFGVGSRMCIGWKFALQEAKVALALLYQRLTFELEPGQDSRGAAAALTLGPKGGVWVRPVPRS